MRFQYLFSLSFLAAAIAPALSLPIVSSDVSLYEARNVDEDVDLLIRDSSIEERDFSDDEVLIREFVNLVPRYTIKPPRQKKTAAQVAHRKNEAHKAAGVNHKPTTPKGQAKSAKAIRTQQAALTKKANRLTAGRNHFGAAAKAHKNTEGLPGRKESFHVKGDRTYSGKDARIANFNSHLFAPRPVDNSPRKFHNAPNLVKKKGVQSVPLPHMKGTGHEFPMTAGNSGGYQGGRKSAARLITQDHIRPSDGKRVTKFAGVVAHDPTQRGSLDHFQVPQAPGNGGRVPRLAAPNPRVAKQMAQLPFH